MVSVSTAFESINTINVGHLGNVLVYVKNIGNTALNNLGIRARTTEHSDWLNLSAPFTTLWCSAGGIKTLAPGAIALIGLNCEVYSHVDIQASVASGSTELDIDGQGGANHKAIAIPELSVSISSGSTSEPFGLAQPIAFAKIGATATGGLTLTLQRKGTDGATWTDTELTHTTVTAEDSTSIWTPEQLINYVNGEMDGYRLSLSSAEAIAVKITGRGDQ